MSHPRITSETSEVPRIRSAGFPTAAYNSGMPSSIRLREDSKKSLHRSSLLLPRKAELFAF